MRTTRSTDRLAPDAAASARASPSLDRALERFTLERRSVLQVEPQAVNHRRARRSRGVEDLADAGEIVHANVDGVASDEASGCLPAVVVVELQLEVERRGTDRLLGNPRRRQPLLNG